MPQNEPKNAENVMQVGLNLFNFRNSSNFNRINYFILRIFLVFEIFFEANDFKDPLY